MAKVAVVTDSIACLPADLVEKHGIFVAPGVTVYYEGKIYRDYLDLTNEQAYEFLGMNSEHFSTSPSVVGFLDIFRKLAREKRPVVCVTLSTGFSALHDMTIEARDALLAEFPGAEIEVIDSRTATAAQGFVALVAARAAEEGLGLNEVVDAALRVRQKVNLFFVFETIRYAYRTGRIPKLGTELGSLLSIKPIVTIKGGIVHFVGVARTKARGLERIISLTREQVGNRPVHVAVVHADVPDEAERLRERVRGEFNCVELWISNFSPVMAYATGRGVVGLAFYPEDGT